MEITNLRERARELLDLRYNVATGVVGVLLPRKNDLYNRKVLDDVTDMLIFQTRLPKRRCRSVALSVMREMRKEYKEKNDAQEGRER